MIIARISSSVTSATFSRSYKLAIFHDTYAVAQAHHVMDVVADQKYPDAFSL